MKRQIVSLTSFQMQKYTYEYMFPKRDFILSRVVNTYVRINFYITCIYNLSMLMMKHVDAMKKLKVQGKSREEISKKLQR